MKKLSALLLALLIALLALTPALAESADAVETAAGEAEATVDEAADAVEEAAGEAEATVEETADEATDAVEEAANEAEAAVEEAAEAAEPSVSPVFKKFTEVPWYVYALLVALFAAGVILAMGSRKTQWNSHSVAMGAMCIAIAFVLSLIRLFRMPQGGSITPAAMLPLVMYMVACGLLQGFVAGCAYGLLQLITDPYVIHPIQLLVDYPLAYGAMILGCLAMLIKVKPQWRLPIAVLLAAVGRYIMAVLSGAIFFAEYAGEQNAWIYSLGYNISYLGPDTLVCMLVACIPGMSRLVDVIGKKK